MVVSREDEKELHELGDKEIPAWLEIPTQMNVNKLCMMMEHLKSEMSEAQDVITEMQNRGITPKRITHFLEELADVKVMATTIQESVLLMKEASGMPSNAVFLAMLMVNTKNRLRGYHEYDKLEDEG